MRLAHTLTTTILALAAVDIANAWAAEVHRLITRAAIANLDSAAPAWLREPAAIAAAEFHSNQADRWRGWRAAPLTHENDPDHFIDIELLAPLGLTLHTVPRLRNEYIAVMAVARHAHPDGVEPHNPEKDPARTQEWPGFVLHAIAEHYAKLQAALNQVQILERLDRDFYAADLAQARGIAIYHLGALSHFVADASQPLHTTKHYNGWVGDNPQAYRWRERFHAYIDEGWARTARLEYEQIRAAAAGMRLAVEAKDPWPNVLAYVGRAHAEMPRLYALERDGTLDGEDGRALLRERLGDGAAMLSAMLRAAIDSSAPTDEQVSKWVFYDGRPDAPPAPTTQPTTRPTP